MTMISTFFLNSPNFMRNEIINPMLLINKIFYDLLTEHEHNGEIFFSWSCGMLFHERSQPMHL